MKKKGGRTGPALSSFLILHSTFFISVFA